MFAVVIALAGKTLQRKLIRPLRRVLVHGFVLGSVAMLSGMAMPGMATTGIRVRVCKAFRVALPIMQHAAGYDLKGVDRNKCADEEWPSEAHKAPRICETTAGPTSPVRVILVISIDVSIHKRGICKLIALTTSGDQIPPRSR